MFNRTKIVTAFMFMAIVCGLFACSSQKRVNEQLESVAKRWCMTIRASQVIPVYPLTEDIQPGDVFLVQVPVDEQQEVYKEKGFLALDNHLHRITLQSTVDGVSSPFDVFYAESFGPFSGDILPNHWLNPSTDDDAWKNAPNAAFPSYSFSVKRGSGFNLALPIQGIPVGLSLIEASSADGTVTIGDAKTYGLDIMGLNVHVDRWLNSDVGDSERTVQQHLQPYGPRVDPITGKTAFNYIRVINRIYLTKRLDISLRDADSKNIGGNFGAAKPVELLLLDPDDESSRVTTETYTSRVAALNTMLDDALSKDAAGNLLPGGSVRVASASASSITMTETFPRPLVIGYLAFDRRIESDGSLGAPIPTHAILEGLFVDPVTLSFDIHQRRLRKSMSTVRRVPELEAREIMTKVVESLGDSFIGAYSRFSQDDKLAGFMNLIMLYWSPEKPGSDIRLIELNRVFDDAI